MSEARDKRLTFESRAAAIQQEASNLVLLVSALFGQVFTTSVWPEEATDDSRSWADRGVSLTNEWAQLEPPPSLEPTWQELLAQFDILSGLLNEVPPLAGLSGDELTDRARWLQAAVSQHLEVMNSTEGRMLREEETLRQLARDGLEDEPPA